MSGEEVGYYVLEIAQMNRVVCCKIANLKCNTGGSDAHVVSKF